MGRHCRHFALTGILSRHSSTGVTAAHLLADTLCHLGSRRRSSAGPQIHTEQGREGNSVGRVSRRAGSCNKGGGTVWGGACGGAQGGSHGGT
eukprot:1159928-Pelagomonas_calceolata.AAC.15